MTVLTGLSVLFVTSCGSSRSVQRTESTELRATESRTDTVKEQMVVAIHDTIREVTTITVDRNEAGDTLKVAQVTERDNIRNRSAVKDKHERIVVKTDTVFVAVRDSSNVQTTNCTNNTNETKGSGLRATLKWIFWIIIALTVLVITIKVSRIIRI